MIEEYKEGMVIGYHGFLNCRVVEDVINGGQFLACDLMYKYSDDVYTTVITRSWFGQWRNHMHLLHGEAYHITWVDFITAFHRQIENNN